MRVFSTLRLLVAALVICASTSFTHAQFVVLNSNDSGIGSLRNAVALANTAGVGTITFSPAVTNINLTSGEIIVTGTNIAIVGNGVTIDANSNSRIFNVATGASFGITNLTLTNGLTNLSGGAILNAGLLALDATTITNSEASGANADQGGGAIASVGTGATVTILDITAPCMFSGNSASGASGSGGAIINGSGSTLSITGASFMNNTANRAGGAIEDVSGALTNTIVDDVAFIGNTVFTSPGNGGAIHLSGDANISVTGGMANNNTAGSEGGAFWNNVGNMTVDNVSFTGNVANGTDADNGGGALFNNGGTLVVQNSSTFDSNTASTGAGSGGAILNTGTLAVLDATFTNNASARAGGAIEATAGTTTNITNSDFERNFTGGAVGNGGALHITGNGNATISGGRFYKNEADAEGGALWNGAGTMSVTDAIIDDNLARGDDLTNGGGGIFNFAGTLNVNAGTVIVRNEATGTAGSGGGILNNDGATLNVADAIIRSNGASRAGGGIEDQSGDATMVTITGTLFRENFTGSAPGNGGAIHITGSGSMDITDGAVERNVAASEGGGFWVDSGTMTVSGTRFSMNVANGSDLGNGGGALFSNGGSLIVTDDASFFKNSAPNGAGSGGAVLLVNGGDLSSTNVSYFGNTANRAGGAIEDQGNIDDMMGATDDGVLVITSSNFEKNQTGASPGNGGGIHISGPGDATISESVFYDNVAAAEGGGFWNGAGTSTVSNTLFRGNVASGDDSDQGGGGIFNLDGGSLTLTDVDFERNVADGTAGSGGGLLNGVGSSLTVTGGIFKKNTSMRAGGGIEDNSGSATTVSLTDVDFRENETGGAPGNGGAIHISGDGNMDINGGFVFRNDAALEGGGFWNGSGTMNVTNTIFRGNTAAGDGADDGGGALFNNGGTLALTDAIVRDNRATGTAGSGGGILNLGMLSVNGGSLLRNSANRAGGGIEDASGMSLMLTDVRFENNDAGTSPGNGGGVHVTGEADVTVQGGVFVRNTAGSEGGALWNDAGSMMISNAVLRENDAQGDDASNGGGGVFNNGADGSILLTDVNLINNLASGASGSGGGALVVAGNLTVVGGEFRGNNASRAGGAIEDASDDDGSMLSVTDAVFVLNSTGSAPGNGGAIHITGAGDATITGGVVRSNVAAAEGGGFWNGGGIMNVVGVEFFNNDANGTASDNGGGALFNNGGTLNVSMSSIYDNFAAADGGGVQNVAGGTLDIMNTTIVTNSATVNGGGIATVGGTTLTNVTVARNSADSGSGGGIYTTGSTDLGSSIVAGNMADGGVDVDDAGGMFSSAGFNVIGNGDGISTQTTDMAGSTGNEQDVRFGAFIRNGGGTPFLTLKCGSVAIDFADPAIMGPDQNGNGIVNGIRDAGAIELQTSCGTPASAVARKDEDLARDLTAATTILASDVTVFPNPVAQDFLNVSLPEIGKQTDILLLDQTGRQLGRLRAISGVNRVDLGDYPNGTYLIRVVNDKDVINKKVMIQR